ncbi:MAG: TonB-dependent receptor [Rhodocyclales bacterium]|nr:TonB-dependent receptor [Rhodocyclales bacterium]
MPHKHPGCLKPIALLLAALSIPAAHAQSASGERELSEVTIQNSRPTVVAGSPAPQAEVTGEQVREFNAVNVEDAVKYLPSLQIRKRYIGDRNAIVASRTAGTVQSARSLVYADGLLLSNLLGNSFAYPPRWNIVGTEELETVNVLYGPYSTTLPGNSTGATILMTTKRPQQPELHARAQVFSQHFKLYGTDETFDGHQEQASAGARFGNLSLSLFGNHLDSKGQPMSFGTATRDPGAGGAAVTGYHRDQDPTGADRVIVSGYGMDHSIQDIGKLRLAYDFSRDTRLAVTLAEWRNNSTSSVDNYLRNAATGAPVSSGTILVGGVRYRLTASHFAPGTSDTVNRLYGVTFDSQLSADWRFEAAASLYRTPTDIVRSASTATSVNGSVTLADDTGWRNLDLRALWKPQQGKAGHAVTFGYHRDDYEYLSRKYNASNWRDEDTRTTLTGRNEGKTQTDALYVQDEWKFAPRWMMTAGLRHERWQAFDGGIYTNTLGSNRFAEREEKATSPKLSLAYDLSSDWLLRASFGKAYRFPTVTELFQTETQGATTRISDPSLKPEKVMASELAAEGAVLGGNLRASWFQEMIRDALYSFTDYTNTSRNQNVDKVRARGIELAYQAQNVLRGLDLGGSVTYVHSRVLENRLNPSSVGKRMIRLPDWRATLFASYHFDERWTGFVGVKYSGTQYNNPDNSDTDSDTYGGNSKFLTVDAKLGYRIARQLTAAIGVDNLTNDKHYAFHPYPQRTYHAEARFDF